MHRNTAGVELAFTLGGVDYVVPAGECVEIPPTYEYAIECRGLPLVKMSYSQIVDAPMALMITPVLPVSPEDEAFVDALVLANTPEVTASTPLKRSPGRPKKK